MKIKNENSKNSNLKSGGLKMKTKRMLTLLAIMLIGVVVNAQSFQMDSKSAQDHQKIQKIKTLVLDHGASLSDFFSFLSSDQQNTLEREIAQIEKCKRRAEVSKACTKAIKRGAKMYQYFPKMPDGKVNNPIEKIQ